MEKEIISRQYFSCESCSNKDICKFAQLFDEKQIMDKIKERVLAGIYEIKDFPFAISITTTCSHYIKPGQRRL